MEKHLAEGVLIVAGSSYLLMGGVAILLGFGGVMADSWKDLDLGFFLTLAVFIVPLVVYLFLVLLPSYTLTSDILIRRRVWLLGLFFHLAIVVGVSWLIRLKGISVDWISILVLPEAIILIMHVLALINLRIKLNDKNI